MQAEREKAHKLVGHAIRDQDLASYLMYPKFFHAYPVEAAESPNDADLARGPQFFDVGGLPVMFSEARLEAGGKRITKAAFRDLITACRLGY